MLSVSASTIILVTVSVDNLLLTQLSGILSEIVVFADQLFANVAGPDEDKHTLYQTDAAKGEVSTSRGNWRDSSN